MSTVQSQAVTSRVDRPGAVKVEAALFSVYDKTGVVELAGAIARAGGRLIASGGTAQALESSGLEVLSIEEYTGLSEGFGGRVKTLHPKIHAGILARRDVPSDLEELARAGAVPLDLVCVNLYPFEESVAAGASEMERTEKIDIGGPALLRAAAKNWRHVVAICDVADVGPLARELDARGTVSFETRRRLAAKVFARTSSYDEAIRADFEGDHEDVLPDRVRVTLTKAADLRYGENPHQKASLYGEGTVKGGGLPGGWNKLRGDELSYNNWIDLCAAAELAHVFDGPAAVIVKHTNPCGAALGGDLAEAWRRALASDPVSAFGGTCGFNRALDAETAREMSSLFLEVVVAPEFGGEALEILARKKALRLVQAPAGVFAKRRREWRALPGGGFLLQEDLGRPLAGAPWKKASKRGVTASELRDLEFAWNVVASVKSNAIVFAKDGRVLAVGAGQMSRVDSVRIAIDKAAEHGHDLAGSVVASDAFFPFADGPRLALEAGASAIAQPGGSKRDQETIDAVDEFGAAMVFTGKRVFRH